jgi:hypothetical protein
MPRQHTTDDLNYRRNRQTLLANNPPCHWCGKYGTKTNPMTADHLIEFDRGGSDDLDNLVPACRNCNSKRGAIYKAKRDALKIQNRNAAVNHFFDTTPPPNTAHQLDLAVEIFEALAPILEKKFGAKVKWSYGRNEVIMPDGTRWLVQAATPKAFHGFSPTYIVADEVWNISRDVLLNGALPSQRVMQSPLLSCWSTAGTEDSQAMLQMREEGLRAIDQGETTKLYFAEWSVPPGIDPMTSPDLWPMANPALGYTLMPDVLEDEAQQVDKAAFLRASLNVWISSENSWLPAGLFDSLKVDEIPAGGVLAVESSIDESVYCGLRAQRMPDDLIGVTVEFVAGSLAGCWRAIEAAAGDCERIALTPSLFDIAPPALDRKKVQVGYAELTTHTATIRSLVIEGRIVHTGEQMLAEHVDRAVGVQSQRGYALSSQKSSGPITLARCLVWAASLLARPASRAKPAIAFGR